MKIMPMGKLALLALALFGVFAPVTAVETPDVSSGTVVPGVWNSNYRAVRVYAEQYCVPMLVYFGSKDCGVSSSFINELNKVDVTAWINRHPIALAFKYGTSEQLSDSQKGTEETTKEPDFRAALTWLRSINKGMTDLPFVGMYWRKPDGTVIARAFPGRLSTIPVVAGSGARTVAERLLALLEKDFGSYTGGGETPVTPTSGTVDMRNLTRLEAQMVNPNLYVKRSFSFPLLADMPQGRVVTGMLNVEQTSVGRLVAKYNGLKSKVLTFKGVWDELNLDTGDALTVLESETGGSMLTLALADNGVLTAAAEISAIYSPAPAPETGCGLHSSAFTSADYANFYGLYTVTLPDAEGNAGAGSLTFNVSRAGKVSWTAVMPDGTKINNDGKVSLALKTDGTAVLTVFKIKKGKYSLTGTFVIEPSAEESWNTGTSFCAVHSAGTSRLRFVNMATEEEFLSVGKGGYFEKNALPRELCEQFGYEETFDLKLDGTTVLQMGTLVNGFAFRKNDVVKAFSYKAADGTFSGTATVTVLGQSIKGNVFGVVTPGIDETSPVFGSGVFYAPDISLPVSLDAERW